MTKIISKEKERSLPTFEKPIGIEVKDVNELSEVENESNSLEQENLEKEVKKAIPEMIPLKEMHEELQMEKSPYNSEVDEFIFELNESLKATLVTKSLESLREHASFQDYVLKQLLGHNFGFLGMDGGKNTIQVLVFRVKLDSKN